MRPKHPRMLYCWRDEEIVPTIQKVGSAEDGAANVGEVLAWRIRTEFLRLLGLHLGFYLLEKGNDNVDNRLGGRGGIRKSRLCSEYYG